MKKLFLTILLVGLWCINLNAAAYNSYCPQWEAGGVVIFNGVQQNVPGAAPSAYCWDTVKIEGYGLYNGLAYGIETLNSTQSAADWFANKALYVYGENYAGVYVYVAVMGYPQNVPTVKLDSTIGVLVSTTNINSPSNSILNGKEYKFFIRKTPVAQVTSLPDLDVKGYIYVYDGATLINRATTYIK